jgi:hypothetical protein
LIDVRFKFLREVWRFYGSGISWGGKGSDLWWFYWWNWLPPHLRYWGLDYTWYDGPIGTFGFWFINWTWRFPWTREPKDFWTKG